MSITDLLIILAFFVSFGALRFGLPALACWLFRVCDDRYIHPHA